MAVQIHCFSETLNPPLQWQADNRHTFEMATAPGNAPWPEMVPTYSEQKPALYGLLVMGVQTAYPFSFGGRGFPKNASREVEKMFLDATDAHNPSYLFREDLEGKMGELMILPNQQALALRPILADFLQALPAFHGNPKHQRIVFWFTGK
jgi:hypothetical protein